MELSVIIVNYRGYACLQNCIASLLAALEYIQAEIIVVDNASETTAATTLQAQYPSIQWIINHDNKGFSKANNQALGLARGKYLLFLNPDTLIARGVFENLIAYINSKPNVGAVGVQMLDGKNEFLPESKRGIPNTRAAFFKMMGLATVFPESHFFNAYALGGLSKDAIHKVEALAGAFLLTPRLVVEKIGGFDERFFMYAEDIDFCYRIQQLGYEIHYVGTITITHFKGTSTNKQSSAYRKHFYGSMELFVKKYSPAIYSRTEKWILVIGIRLAGCLAAVKSFLFRLGNRY